MEKKLIILFCVLAVAAQAHGQGKTVAVQPKEVIVATVGNESFDLDSSEEVIPAGSDSKRLVGIAWEYVREILHRQGYTIRLRLYPWARALSMCKSGVVDIIYPASVNAERKLDFTFSKKPVYTIKYLPYVNANSSLEWKNLDSLKGKNVGLMSSWSYGDDFMNSGQFSKLPVNTIEEGFLMLEARRIDAFIGYEANHDRYLNRNGIAGKFRKLPAFGSAFEYCMGASGNPRVQAILDDFDKGFQALESDGRLKKLDALWTGK